MLAAFITNYITSQPTPVVEFVWQGGEPTLLGIDFFKRVIELQKPFVGKKTITNSLQTNGTLLTDEWCRFLKKNNFMVGISLDGPKEIHDRYRRDQKGNGTFDQVMRGLRLLQKHKVDYNVLACVARETAQGPSMYTVSSKRKGWSSSSLPRSSNACPIRSRATAGLRLAGPAALDRRDQQGDVTPWSVIPEEYGDFLIAIYEEWVRHDVGTVFVMNFEWALNAWIGNPSPVCVHAKTVRPFGRHRAQRRRLCLRPLRLPPVQARQHPDRTLCRRWWQKSCNPGSASARKRPCRAGAVSARCCRRATEDARNIDSETTYYDEPGLAVSLRRL